MYLHHLTVSLRSHKACTIMGLQLGASISSTDENTDPNILNRHGPQPNISNRRRSRANNILPQPQLSAPAPESIPTEMIPNQISAADVGDPSIYIRSQATLSPDTKDTPDFSNRRLGQSNYLQLPPQLPEIFSTKARAFEPSVVASPGPSIILSSGLPPIRLSEALLTCILKRLFACLFMVVWLAHPFNDKITVMRCSYPFYARTPINPYD